MLPFVAQFGVLAHKIEMLLTVVADDTEVDLDDSPVVSIIGVAEMVVSFLQHHHM